jgi:hypothetical protein
MTESDDALCLEPIREVGAVTFSPRNENLVRSAPNLALESVRLGRRNVRRSGIVE